MEGRSELFKEARRACTGAVVTIASTTVILYVRYTCFLRQLLFRDSKLTEGDRCGRYDCSENIIFSFTRELDVEAGCVVSALFFTVLLLSSLFSPRQ